MNRLVYIDFLRVFSAFSVVVIHVAITAIAVFPGKPIELIQDYSQLDIFISWLMVNVNRFAVPMFVMITGLLLLKPDKEISINELFKKYIWRIAFVIIIYGTAFAYIEILFDKSGSNQILNFINSFKNALIGKSWDHLWYLYMLLGLYLILPLLKVFVTFSNKQQLLYIITIGFVLVSIIPIISTLFSVNLSFYFPIKSIFIFYLLWGYYLGHYSIKLDKHSITIGLVSLLLIILFTFLFVFYKNKIFNQLIYPYTSPLYIGLSSSIFIVFKKLNSKLSNYYTNFVKLLSRCSFGIYIYHIFFIHIVFKFLKFNPFNHNIFIVYPIIILVVFSLSFIATYITIKIPILKKYI